jgi:hypothetical protein
MKLIKNRIFEIISLAALVCCVQTAIAVAQDGTGASSIISFTQGERQDGGIVDGMRSNPNNALGLPTDPPVNPDEEPWVSLGFPHNGVAGTITLGFTCRIVNGTGNDVSVFENTTISGYPLEQVRVEALDPNTNMFVVIGFAGNEQQPNITRTDLDLGGLPYTMQIRLTDVTVRGIHDPTADAFDVNAVVAIHGDCGTSPSVGQFVIGNLVNINPGSTVYYWGAQWRQNNPVSGTVQTNSFKGFEDGTGALTCGDTWMSRPGNSTPPPPTVPAIMDVIVSDNIVKSGPILSGTVIKIVRIETLPGYDPNPGHEGRGTVISTVCDSTAPIIAPKVSRKAPASAVDLN